MGGPDFSPGFKAHRFMLFLVYESERINPERSSGLLVPLRALIPRPRSRPPMWSAPLINTYLRACGQSTLDSGVRQNDSHPGLYLVGQEPCALPYSTVSAPLARCQVRGAPDLGDSFARFDTATKVAATHVVSSFQRCLAQSMWSIDFGFWRSPE
jgi:hypothetical protein